MQENHHVFFESDRLIFRQWKEEDKIIFAQMNADPEVMKFFPKKLSKTESDVFAERIIEGIKTRNYGLWAAEIKTSKQFIGFIGFNYTDFKSDFTPCIEIGWRLGKDFWNLGYASEGAKAALLYGSQVLHFKEVYSFTSKLNLRSEKVMKKIGMQKEGDFFHPKIDVSEALCEHVLYKKLLLETSSDQEAPAVIHS